MKNLQIPIVGFAIQLKLYRILKCKSQENIIEINEFLHFLKEIILNRNDNSDL